MNLTREQRIEMTTRVACALISTGHFTDSGESGGTEPFLVHVADDGCREVPALREALHTVLDEIERSVEVDEDLESQLQAEKEEAKP